MKLEDQRKKIEAVCEDQRTSTLESAATRALCGHDPDLLRYTRPLTLLDVSYTHYTSMYVIVHVSAYVNVPTHKLEPSQSFLFITSSFHQ